MRAGSRPDSQRRTPARPVRGLLRVLTAFALLAGVLVVAPATPARAAGSIALAKSATANILLGGTVEYTLTATNPDPAVEQYNLSFTDTLPPGVTYLGGSTSPANLGEPQVVTITDPGGDHQVLVWSNVSDLTPGSTRRLTFRAAVDPDRYPIGTTVTNTAAAFSSSDPREVPGFGPTGDPLPGAEVVSASDDSSSTVTAIRITKASGAAGEGTPEGELLRGVNDHQAVFTLRVTNNRVDTTGGIVVTDYLPAGLEFLGCGGGSFNSATPEYPGASNQVRTVAGCTEPRTVETVTNPAGHPAGVYTRVTWRLDDLGPDGVYTIRYGAGIPQRANVATWPGTAPDPASGGQAANLDNNTGPSTRETTSEIALRNEAEVAGDFQGAPVADTTSHTVSAEDLRIVKDVEPTQFVQGRLVTYTLTLDTGEYADADGLTIEDILPDGLCPMGTADPGYVPTPECDPAQGAAPGNADITRVVPNADGTFTLTIIPDADALAANGTLVITYQALMQQRYDAVDGPTSANDSFTNTVRVDATTTPRPDVDPPAPAGELEVSDESSATITSAQPVLTKLRMANATPMQCSTDGADYARTFTDEPAFTEGDRVCFLLRVDFPGGVDTRNAQLTDFLPTNMTLESITAITGAGLVAATTPASPTTYVTWTLGTGTPQVVPRGSVFEVVLSAIVERPVPLSDPPRALDRDNLAKFRWTNTAGQSESLRDASSVPLGPPPPIGLVKGVQAVNGTVVDGGAAPGDVDGTTVRASDQVRFRIDLGNLSVPGEVNADDLSAPDVWDVLPAGITCAAVSDISDGGTCYDAGAPGRPNVAGNSTAAVVRWQLPAAFTLAPQENRTLLYTMAVPATASVSTRFDNVAGVVSYTSATNLGGATPPVAVHHPAENLSGDVTPSGTDVPAANDPSWVALPDAVVTKVGTTSVTEAGNTAAQAVVGESVSYVIGVRIPAGTTVYRGRLVDVLPPGVVPVGPASAGYSAAGTSPATAPLPAAVSLDPATGALDFGDAYANATTTDQLFEVTIPARIGTDAGNTHGVARTNTASFTSDTGAGGTPLPPRTATSTVTIVEPSLDLTKSASPTTNLSGGSTVTYTLGVANAASRPPLHDTAVTDCLPAGLTFAAFSAGFPAGTTAAGDGTNGCPAGTTRITWTLASVAGGSTTTLRYTATVNASPAAGQSYTNTASAAGSSLADGGNGGPTERTYTDTASALIRLAGATVAKTATPTTLTIGERGSFTVQVTLPANIAFYNSMVSDVMPDGFVLSGITTDSVTCTGGTPCTVSGAALTPGGTGNRTIGWLVGTMPASATVRTIRITYSATVSDIPGNVAGVGRQNTAAYRWNYTALTDPTAATATLNASATANRSVTIVEPALQVAKAVTDTTPDPGQVFDYTVTVRNNARPNNLSPAYNYTVTDTVPAGVVVDPATLTGGTLTGTDANGSGGTITWGPIAGPLAVNGSATFNYSARLAPSSSLRDDPLVNTASVTRYESLPSGGRTYPAVSATATVTAQFPHVTPAKVAAPGPAYLGVPKAWTITLTNDGTADAYRVGATDTLPANWSYDTGSATVVVAGGPATPVEPVLSTDGSGRVVLSWTGLGRIPATGADTIVITFTATPRDPEAAADPGVGSGVAHTNTVSTSAEDATGATGDLDGPFAGGPATASTAIHSADLSVTKTSGDAVAGRPLSYTVTVRNHGPDPAVGPFVVTDTLPDGLGGVTATGTGWTCSPATATVTCARTNPADTLAANASFPVITVTAAVPAGIADGTVLTNQVSVAGTTHDPDPTNNVDEVTDTVDRAADLGVAKRTSGTVVAGQPVTYTLDVANLGPSDSAGPIVLTDTLPADTGFRSATGDGWACTAAGRTLTCTRADGLANGAAAPQLSVTVDVPADRAGSLVNAAEVDGPETDPVAGNNTDEVTDPVTTLADLALAKSHVGEFVPGGEASYEFTVTNLGPSDAAAPVRITDQLPAELSFVSDDSAGWDCSATPANLLTCAGGTLPAGASRTFRVTVAIDPAHVGDVENTATVSSPTTDPHQPNNTDGDSTGITTESDLAVEKSHTGDAVAGETLAFTLTVRNLGRSDSPGTVVVTDTLPVGLDYASASGAGWSCSASGRVVTCERPAGLAAGASSGLTVTVDVSPGAGPDVLVNRASVTGPARDPELGNNTSADAVTVRDEANVQVTKAVGPGPVAAGDVVAWTLTLSNDGPSDADDVRVVDALPAGLELVAVEPQAPFTCAEGEPVDCLAPTLPAGATTTIEVRTRVGSGVGDGTTITNRAVVSTSTPGDLPEDNESSAAIDVVTSADLSVVKSHEQDGVVAGGQVTFALAVHNAGPSDAAADVVVTDSLPPGLTFLSSDGPAWDCSAVPATPSGQEVTCTLTGDVPLVAGTDAPPLSLVTQVDAGLDPDTLPDGILTNTADVSSPTPDPDPDNNSDNDAVPVTTSADLVVTKSHAGPVLIGTELAFTLAVENLGLSAATGVQVTDDLPAGLDPVAVDATDWVCTVTGRSLACDLETALAPGATAPPITVLATVLPAAFPSVVNTAAVDAVTPDPDLDNNVAADPVLVPPQVDLAVTKSHQPEPLQVGGQAAYTIAVSNAGSTDDPGPLTVLDTLPTGLTYVSGGGLGWTCDATGQEVVCTRPSGLETTGTTSLELVVSVGPAAYPGVTNTVRVQSAAEDTNPANNTAQDPATVLPSYDLSLRKDLDGIRGDRASWTITVSNAGPNEAPSGVVVVDDLPRELSFLDYSGEGWTCAAAGRLVTCSYDQPIAVGQSVAVTLETAIDPGATGTIRNTAGIVGGVTDDAEGRIPSDLDDLASTGGFAGGAALLGLLLLGGGAVLLRRRWSPSP